MRSVLMPQRNSGEIKINEATALCKADKSREGFTLMAKLARFIGHLESHRGITPEL
jgi:hypothetical protein